jgi:hypothetical protein
VIVSATSAAFRDHASASRPGDDSLRANFARHFSATGRQSAMKAGRRGFESGRKRPDGMPFEALPAYWPSRTWLDAEPNAELGAKRNLCLGRATCIYPFAGRAAMYSSSSDVPNDWP